MMRITLIPNQQVKMIAVAEPVPDELRAKKGVEFFPTLWLHMDAIP